MDKLVSPELECLVLDQFNEGDQETPGVRSVYNQSLQQNSERVSVKTIINVIMNVKSQLLNTKKIYTHIFMEIRYGSGLAFKPK